MKWNITQLYSYSGMVTCVIYQYINCSPLINWLQDINKCEKTWQIPKLAIEIYWKNVLLTVLIIDSTSSSFETSPAKVRACPPDLSIYKHELQMLNNRTTNNVFRVPIVYWNKIDNPFLNLINSVVQEINSHVVKLICFFRHGVLLNSFLNEDINSFTRIKVSSTQGFLFSGK